MTTIYTNSCFSSRAHWFKVGKIANKRTKKALLIINFQNVKQCTNYLPAQSYQININKTNR